MESSPQVAVLYQGASLRVSVGGQWRMDRALPVDQALEDIADTHVRELYLEAKNLDSWDTSLLVFLVRLIRTAQTRDIAVNMELPDGLKHLVRMAFAVPAQVGAARASTRDSLFSAVGGAALALIPRLTLFLCFIGEIVTSFRRLLSGRAQMRIQDFVDAVYECGVCSLPIIALTSLLFGLILAFVGAIQLTRFGAQIYVAGLVGIGMLRVMGAVMVGVVMSGRVGAAYAALIGAMRVNEEVDALSVAGISPIDFLVLPRVLALTLMTPFLTLYADLMGICGGYFVGVVILDLNPLEYVTATAQMTSFRHMFIGLVYGTVFGVIISVAGCRQGIFCAGSAQAVGQATTKAVVQSIVGIIVATALLTVIFNVLDV
ncbi:MAG: ABC transporter permease [Candidatus Desulfovibrio kirbyi]|jgi:phospholipid/cholesterol/gamma-HCH transport system permease protein|uniref:ABC transporter permease n=1 Tax=Candidatus Desulfovibrio kirbyi TaxID=2696086 RepID=A0A6L2R557_9BACT|nr:ABC transporter permease [Desulfovibrio sp.]GFH62554.1 MAG: ABC transporter permease [Candidatus Desulfovibrio kirbyi]